MKLTALILLLAPLVAAEPATLAIRNIHFDAKKATVDFDVVSQSAKLVRSWLITVALGNGTSLVTPRNCTPAGHCQADVDFGERNASGLEPEVRVSAVLFEDGTAEGDLKLLQSEIDDTRIRLRALEAWQKDFNKTPPDIAYTSAAMDEREIVELLVSKLTPAQRSAMLEQRVRAARDLARLFPAGATRFAPAETVASTLAIANRTRIAIVREEEHNDRLRLVLRNDYDKDIVAFAFIEHQADGRLMRSSNGHIIVPGGLQEFDYGPMINPVELACVIFGDGSADGDPALIQKMRDGWAGRKAEKDRILPLLRAITKLPASERVAATGKLIADLQAQPQEQPDAAHSIDYVLGEQAERKAAVRDLRSLGLGESLTDLHE